MSKWLSLKVFEWAIGMVCIIMVCILAGVLCLSVWAYTFVTVQTALGIVALIVLPVFVGKLFTGVRR